MRRKILELSPEALCEMLQGHDMSEVQTDFPPDATIVGCGWDERRNIIRLAVESATFDELPDGFFAPPMSMAITSRLSELEAVLRLVRPES